MRDNKLSQPQSNEKILFGLRGRLFSYAVVFLLVIVAIAGITSVWKQWAVAPELSGFKDAKIGSQTAVLEVSDTPEKRKLGLSGRQFLPQYQGMLFVFDNSGRQCIWMKDMNFSIDIIWADADKTVTHIEADVSPQTYPRTFCGGLAPSRYVIELNSGTAAQAGLKTGDKISF